MPEWTSVAPHLFDIVTGYFPEAKPKANWEENPRPMLVTGVFRGKSTGEIRVRVAYGTSQIRKIRYPNLNIGNMSHLDALNLSRPTAFVIKPGSQQVILPWSEARFHPWRLFKTPVISRLPQDMQDHVKRVMKGLTDLPMP